MRILHAVEFYHPSKGGMQEVVKQLSQNLVNFGHDVTVVTTKLAERKSNRLNGVNIKEFNVSGNFVRGLKGEIRDYQDFLINSDFDVVTNFAAQQWATDLTFSIIDKIKAKKVLVPTGFSGLYESQYQDYFKKMPSWMGKYDMNVFLSDNYRDVDFAKEHGIKNRILIPNGASRKEFSPKIAIDIKKKLKIPKDHFLILHVGSHTGGKGHKEAMEIFNYSDLRKATLLIVGDGNGGCFKDCKKRALKFNLNLRNILNRKKVLIKNLSRKETLAAYHQADLFLFPSNIECSPLVLFEAMASRTPFLTSDVGNSREIIKWSGAGMILPTQKNEIEQSRVITSKSIKILNKIYKSEEKRKEMAQNGFQAWRERFTWEKIAKDYEKLYFSLINQK